MESQSTNDDQVNSCKTDYFKLFVHRVGNCSVTILSQYFCVLKTKYIPKKATFDCTKQELNLYSIDSLHPEVL